MSPCQMIGKSLPEQQTEDEYTYLVRKKFAGSLCIPFPQTNDEMSRFSPLHE